MAQTTPRIQGNLLDVPSSFEWVEYMKWSEKYNSDIVSFTVAGTSVVVLNSQEVVSDLMEKRGKIYSSRSVAAHINLIEC
ncbi:hypothetical protein VKT23_010868 [Stygiomarasmius scandens]|uniref:Uncharacterized protein n=1 Tax=Marasmiellus scandens TaxID=2682957 RepID=A0ABR1JF42_9AGAR